MIRLARPDELPALRDLEIAAAEPFRAAGMTEVAEDEPFSVAQLRAYQGDGRCWVSVAADSPVAYLVADVLDGRGHVEQVSVLPSFARRGLGRELIDTAGSWARSLSLPALTLTTFRDVPWNGPYYARLGFRELPEPEWGPALRAVRAHEAALGLDRWPRIAMIR